MADRKAALGDEHSPDSLHGRIADLEAENRCLRQQLLRERNILDAISNPVFLKDLEGRYVACNEAMAVLSRRDRSEIIGKTSADLAPPEVAAGRTRPSTTTCSSVAADDPTWSGWRRARIRRLWNCW